MRAIRYYKGEEEDMSKEDGKFVCLAFFPCEQKREMSNVWFYYVYLNWFCTLTWADSVLKPHISSLAVCAGSAASYTSQILSLLLPSAKLCRSHFD